MRFQLASFTLARVKNFSFAALILSLAGCGQQSATTFSSRERVVPHTIGLQASEQSRLAFNAGAESRGGVQSSILVRAKHIFCSGAEYNEEKLEKDLPSFFKDGNSINSGEKDKHGNEMWCPKLTDPEKWVCLTDTYDFLGDNSGCPYKDGINNESLVKYNKYCKGRPNVEAFNKSAYLHPSDKYPDCKICGELNGRCEAPKDKSFTVTAVGTYACILKIPASSEAPATAAKSE